MPSPEKLSPTLRLAQQLVQRESITPADAGCQELILARLTACGFVGEWMSRGAVTNLWATRAGGKTAARPLLVFAGHTDVVPPGPLAQWRRPPFQGAVENGQLHGRGAADMKGGLASFITAAERFIAKHPRHRGALGLLLTSDEEGPAHDGTRAVLEKLSARGRQIDMCIVGEPSSDKQLGDTIKVGRRGSLNAAVRVRGRQTHIAYPERNPIHTAARMVAELAALSWEDADDMFPPTALQVSNFHAGAGAENIIPGEVEIQFNLRYSPQTSAPAIRARLEKILRRYAPAVEITWRLSGEPFYTRAGQLLRAVEAGIAEITGQTARRSAGGGTSDGRFIASTGAQVVELGPRNATIHQINECVGADELEQLSQIYERILEKILGGRA